MMNMIPCKLEKKCTGCMACYNICPYNAITIIDNDEGFKFPNIDLNKCKKCNLCKKVCALTSNQKNKKFPKGYAAYIKNEKIRNESSSGGMFTAIAVEVIKKGGIVFGAIFDENYNVIHNSCDSIEQLYKLRGAKYVQSFINNTFLKVKEELKKGRLVYFTGTPCQIAGLKAYLGKKHENLISSDLICHGVPSPKVWKKYLNDTVNGKIYFVSFRDKKYGWTNYSLKIKSKKEEYLFNGIDNTYMKGFIDNYFLRPSCYDCRFKGLNRVGDITLADFWGLDNILSNFDNENKGTSFIMVNSELGEKFFDMIKGKIVYQEIEVNKVINYNKSAISSSYCPIQRKRFFNELDKKNYKTLLQEVEKLSIKERILLKIK